MQLKQENEKGRNKTPLVVFWRNRPHKDKLPLAFHWRVTTPLTSETGASVRPACAVETNKDGFGLGKRGQEADGGVASHKISAGGVRGQKKNLQNSLEVHTSPDFKRCV